MHKLGSWSRWVVGLAAFVILWSGGCGDCVEATADMRRFVLEDAHQVCQEDADCVAAGVGCAELDFAFCGQVGMNREAAESDEWRTLVDEASCESSCSQCGGALIPGCAGGRCFSPDN